MKYNKLSILGLSLLFVSQACTNIDDEVSYSSGEKPIVTVNSTSISVNEGEDIILSLTSSFAYNSDMDFKIEVIGGTADILDVLYNESDEAAPPVLGMIKATGINPDASGVDGYRFFMPATQTNFNITIGSAVLDYVPEGAETFQIKLTSTGNKYGLVDTNTEIIDVTINDVNTFNPYVANDMLEITLNWASLPSYLGDLDFDIEVYDSGLNPYDDSYYDHPEMITFDSSTPDDTYFIIVEFFSNMGLETEGYIPLRLSFTKPGGWSQSVDIDKFSSVDGGYYDNGYTNPFSDESFIKIFMVEKNGDQYTVYDEDSNEIASGRQANIANLLKDKYSSTRRR